VSAVRALQSAASVEGQLTALRRRVAADGNEAGTRQGGICGRLSVKRTGRWSDFPGSVVGLPGEGGAAGRGDHALVLTHHWAPRGWRARYGCGNAARAGTLLGTVADQGRPSRGCSSMVEPQPSKLVMRVRFPSSALVSAVQRDVSIFFWDAFVVQQPLRATHVHVNAWVQAFSFPVLGDSRSLAVERSHEPVAVRDHRARPQGSVLATAPYAWRFYHA
jgi:hypothetical protein